jgi:hypothetical protein
LSQKADPGRQKLSHRSPPGDHYDHHSVTIMARKQAAPLMRDMLRFYGRGKGVLKTARRLGRASVETPGSMPPGLGWWRLATALGKSACVQLDRTNYRLSTFVYMNVFNTDELRPSISQPTKSLDLG